MKHSFARSALLSGVFSAFMITSAHADNSTIENALRNRPDLSIFYQNLIDSGVMAELKEGQSYTVFAPTNDAFAKIKPEQYPCFYSGDCKAQIADVLRNHIVSGEKQLEDLGGHPGEGIMSMFSINHQHLTAGEPYKDHYSINGSNILSESQLAGGILYRIDDVLVGGPDMVKLIESPTPVMVVKKGTTLPPRVPDGEIVTITTETPVPPAK